MVLEDKLAEKNHHSQEKDSEIVTVLILNKKVRAISKKVELLFTKETIQIVNYTRDRNQCY